ncbi:MAG: DUF5908 family protein [Bacteroidota bacterium]
MPLTIRELHVRMVVEENRQPKKETGANQQQLLSEEKLIQKCIEAVLQILEDQKEK